MNRIFNILILEQSPENQELIRNQLIIKQNYQITFISDPELLTTTLEKKNYHVFMIDENDKLNALEILQTVKNNYPTMKRVLISDKISYEYAEKAIEKGGVSGYILKPWQPEYLLNYLHLLYKKVFMIIEPPSKLLIIIADWNQETGVNILAKYPREFPQSPEEIAHACFSASVGSFGIENEFDDQPITLPLDRIHRTARIHFDTRLKMGNPQPFGIFVLPQEYSKATEKKIDEAVKNQLQHISEELYYSPEIALQIIKQKINEE